MNIGYFFAVSAGIQKGGALAFMADTGICRWTGYGFCPLCFKQGI